MATPSVLLLEDDDPIRESTCELLTALGFKPIEAKALKEALWKVQNQKFECILVDLTLNEGSGEDLIREVRSSRDGPNFRTPILLVSGNLTPDLLLKLRNQINGVIAKPFCAQQLATKIRGVVAPAARA